MAVSHGYSDHPVLRSPVVSLSSHRSTITFSVPFNDFHRLHTAVSKPKFLSYTLLPGVSSKPRMSSSISPAIQNPLIESLKTPNPFEGLLSGSTQTVTTLGPAFSRPCFRCCDEECSNRVIEHALHSCGSRDGEMVGSLQWGFDG